MLSKSELKELKSLHQKKYRESKGMFLVEGDKSVQEAIGSHACVKLIFAIDTWSGFDTAEGHGIITQVISEKQLGQICELKNPNQAVALVELPKSSEIPPSLNDSWHIYLERLQDPGNLGTILRIADWYGMNAILCSPDCVEPFNQKVIQASMGAVFRVKVHVMDRSELIQKANHESVKLFATTMNGKNIHQLKAGSSGILMMGNEGGGLSDLLMASASEKVTIPGKGQAESLNVAVATGILTDWIYRTS